MVKVSRSKGPRFKKRTRGVRRGEKEALLGRMAFAGRQDARIEEGSFAALRMTGLVWSRRWMASFVYG
jgi:hypothetical protein